MRLPFKAWYFRSTIDEELIREKFKEFTIEFIDPLVIKINETNRIMITSFGAVVFFPFDEEVAKLVTSRIAETLGDPHVVMEVEDRLIVETSRPETKILHNEVWLKEEEFSPIQLRIIAMLLAQSVALDNLDHEADRAIGEFNVYLNDLRERGRISIKAKKILRSIGFAMQTRFSVLSNLALFDKPSETWESEQIENLYEGMKDFFDIAERQMALSAKLDFISENTRMLFEVLSSRKSQSLEWIVIVLIAVEILGFGLYEMVRGIIVK
jgi:required for meiotic nuclear division protein 1